MDEFNYHDPVDESISLHQGIRIYTETGARIIFRLSGTGSSGATIRMYMEKYESASDRLNLRTAVGFEGNALCIGCNAIGFASGSFHFSDGGYYR